MEIQLVDGTVRDLDAVDPAELDRLQWEQERAYAEVIRKAPRGSEERALAFRNGYDTVTRILARRAGANVQDGLVMGFSPRYVRLVTGLLQQQSRHREQPARLFEVGYGSGAMLAAAVRAGYDVAGIEVSQNMQEQAQSRLPEEWHSQLYLGDFLSLDLAGQEPFQVVYWNDVFEHLPPDESVDFLRKIYALLSPGGVLVTITPNWHLRPSDITGEYRPPRSTAEGFHLKEYTLREMRDVLHTAGFSRVTMPWFVTKKNSYMCGSGGLGCKCWFEPMLEKLPFKLSRLLCRGLALNCTLAWK